MGCTDEQVAAKHAQMRGKVLIFQQGAADLESYPEEGMKARCMGFRRKLDGDIVEMVVNYAEFEDHNKRFESANYYDKSGVATLTAREAGHYRITDTLYLDGENGVDWDELFVVDATEEEVTITLTQYELTQLRDWLNGRPGVDKDAVQALAYRI